MKEHNKLPNLNILNHFFYLEDGRLFWRVNNTSGINGVYYNKKTKKWYSQIKVNYKTIHLGSFHEKQDAVTAREKADMFYNFHSNHGR